MLDVALLGTGGMMPLPNRFLTSLLCRYNGRFILIDCGEGTQITLKMLGWGFKNIDVICFTHYHADHISGLPGMLLTIGNSGRTEPITLIGPKGLERVYYGLMTIAPELPFDVRLVEIDRDGVVFEKEDFSVSTVRAEHMISCYAYSICVKRKGRFDVDRALALGLPKNFWSVLQKGKDVDYQGKVYTHDMVLGEERKGIKVCYCTDSRPFGALADFVSEADLFICEGMYGEEEKLDKALEHKHMLFREAAEIAAKGHVKELWLTHFSPALTNPEIFSPEVKKIFENTITGYDRMSKTILFEN